MGCHFLLQRILPTRGWNSGLLYGQAGSLPLSHLRSPKHHTLKTQSCPLENVSNVHRGLMGGMSPSRGSDLINKGKGSSSPESRTTLMVGVFTVHFKKHWPNMLKGTPHFHLSYRHFFLANLSYFFGYFKLVYSDLLIELNAQYL